MAIKRKWIRIALKTTTIVLGVFFVVLSVLIYRFTKPKTEEFIYKKFDNQAYQPIISHVKYKDYKVRVISMQKELDTALPTLLFVHGSPGSGMDFKRYLADAVLNTKSNIITYDRIGYSTDTKEVVLNNIDEEIEVLNRISQNLNPKNIILIGYSYGGTIVAASPNKYKSKILLAPAIKGELEPLFWLLNIPQWKITSPLVPNVFINATKEKMKHLNELPLYENKWAISSSYVTSIHGNSDRIVPFKNSIFLKSKFSEKQFNLVTIEKGNHALVWINFDLIKEKIIETIEN